MRVALVNVSKPEHGTGDGITEYTYQLYKNLKGYKGVSVDCFYALEKTKRVNTWGLIYTQTLFKNKVVRLLKNRYDVVHITNHEVGFVAKILKKQNSDAKILTTMHDTMRLRTYMHKGIKQRVYNYLIKHHMEDAISYSDFLLFYEPKTVTELKVFKQFRNYKVIHLGVPDTLVKTKIHKKKSRKFVVGYLGSFAHNKNVIVIFKAANLLKNRKDCQFDIYGTGFELNNLTRYKNSNRLNNLRMLGFAAEENKAAIYDSFDVFVFPTFGENYNLPILEAMARGLPVIISKDSDLIDEVKKYCFEVGNEYELAELLTKFREKKVNRNKIRAGLNFARGLTWQKTAERTLEIYKDLLNKKK